MYARRDDVRQFLTALRARITPERAGLTVFGGGDRRVPGLRREEVAQLAGVSTAYYTRMERGDLGGVSESVLWALVRALQLDDAETLHLFDLARDATGTTRVSAPQARAAGSCHTHTGDRHDEGVPTLAMTGLGDTVASNELGRVLFPHLFLEAGSPLNHSRYRIRDARSQVFYPDWDDSARGVVSTLRLLAGHDPSGRALMSLVGELATRSDDCRRW